MKSSKKMLIDRPDEIAVPSISYKLVSEVGQQTQYKGACVPFPTVLLEYLDNAELKLLGLLLRTRRETGRCTASLKDLSKGMGITHIALSKITVRLQKMGIIVMATGFGRKRDKQICFENIQKLSDYLENMRPGAAVALRKKMKEKDISNIPPSIDLHMKANYAYSEDEVENEEYN